MSHDVDNQRFRATLESGCWPAIYTSFASSEIGTALRALLTGHELRPVARQT